MSTRFLFLLVAPGCASESAAPPSSEAEGPWLAEAAARAEAATYAFEPDGRAWVARSGRQGLAARFSPTGVAIAGEEGAVTLTLDAWGAEGALLPAEDPTWAPGACVSSGAIDPTGACIRRLDGARVGLVEWWANTPEGLEQGFTIERSPGAGDLLLDLRVDGADVAMTGDHATFLLEDGGTLRYDHLLVLDATGRALDARMEPLPGGLRLRVDTEGAVYPLDVDPIVSAYWTAFGASVFNYFGYAVDGAGDVNGDGYDDIVIGAYGYSSSAGRAYVYHGSATGLSPDAAWYTGGTYSGDSFGYTVAGAGDLNGDGYDDIAVGAPYDGGTTYSDEGSVKVYYGSATGLSRSTSLTSGLSRSRVYFGIALGGGGDVNGDGYDDLAVGATGYESGGTYGLARVYYGSAAGVSTTSTWSHSTTQAGANLGASVAVVRDVNGDGYDEVAIGAPDYDHGHTDEGEVFVFYGAAAGPAATADWSYDPDGTDVNAGSAVAGAGDVNRDGYGDLLIGAEGYTSPTTAEGAVLLFRGSATGLPRLESWNYQSSMPGGHLGTDMDGAGDVNGDGYDDVIIGAPYVADGRVYVFHGNSSSLPSSPTLTVDAYDEESLGQGAAGAGDVDGDGYADIVFGLPDYTGGATSRGAARVLFGSASGVTDEDPWPYELAMEYVGSVASSAGDVNGDGYGDIAVYIATWTAPRVFVYHGNRSGTFTSATSLSGAMSVNYGQVIAPAGDVNGDGYDDLVVTAHLADPVGSNSGSVFVYTGSASGLSTSRYTQIDGTLTYAQLGSSAAGLGDVNGDGYDDIALGASGWSSAWGAVFVHHGSAAGIATTPTTTILGDQASAYLGSTVTAAGDVNGDGYADLLLGAERYDDGSTDEGAAFLVYGSATGLASTWSWRAGGDQTSASCDEVAGVGDVNGDGYDDVALGCEAYDGSADAAGRVRVWFGGPSGPATAHDWQFTGSAASEYVGAGVTDLGDLNADGYDDFAVGAHGRADYFDGQGAVDIFLGSATGPASTATFSFVDQSEDAEMGHLVDRLDDFDGDGRDELLTAGSGSDTVYVFTFEDADSDGVLSELDCDDGDADVFPGNAEACDGVDNDCDGAVDESIPTWYTDADGDGYGATSSATAACSAPSGAIATGGDCDDTTAAVNPLAIETCNGADDDCDGTADEPDASGASTFYADTDADGYGDPAAAEVACTPSAGHVADAGDCDDTRATVSPAGEEACNGRDDDCDGASDEPGSPAEPTWYVDTDGDGHGTSAATTHACSAPAGYAATATDCDDGDAGVSPSAVETCDGADDDCDGTVDDGVLTSWYADVDGDGYGTAATSVAACTAPASFVSNAFDCDDAAGTTHPGAPETCNGVDDDCSGAADPATSTDAATWYADADGDGFGNAGAPQRACAAPPGYVSDATDCDDADAASHPGAAEVWYDGADQACDGGNDDDADGDGHDATAAGGADCDDSVATIHPGAEDPWYDGVDTNCDAADDYDADGDGHASATYGGSDCDDADPAVYVGAPDDPYDGVVTDCASAGDYDADEDGHLSATYGGDDCDDARSDVYPGAAESWYDGIDQDCDGNDVDQDGDGVPADTDCDDEDPTVTTCDTGEDTGADTGPGDTDPEPDTDDPDVVTDTDDPEDDTPADKDGGAACAGAGALGFGWAGMFVAMIAAVARRGDRWP